MANLNCPTCDKNYDSDRLRVYKCPDCKTWLQWGTDVAESTHVPEVKVEDPMANLDPATRAIVMASNRTTYAIRSLAIFFFTTLCTSLVGYGLVGAGANAALKCGSYYSDCGSTGLAIGGWLIIAIGFLIGVITGAKELGKSRP
jgi:hypothetical protein